MAQRGKALASIVEAFGPNAVPVTLPTPDGKSLVDVVFDGRTVRIGDAVVDLGSDDAVAPVLR